MSNLTDEHQACLDEIDTLNYDPQTEGVNTALTCFLDLDFDSAIVGLSHHLRGKVMGWCEVKNTSPEPGVMDFELWTAELSDFAVIRLRRVSAQRCAVDFHPVFLPEWGYRPGVPTEREEWEGRKIRNQRAKAHLKAVLGYALEQMLIEAKSTQAVQVWRSTGTVNYGKAGRKRDPLYDQAYAMTCAGTSQADARQWYLDQMRYQPDDRDAIKAFDRAMARRRKATK